MAHATEVTLLWDKNNEPDLAGYRLYQADREGDHTSAWAMVQTITAPTSTTTFTVTTGKNYAWYVTAYDTSGNESHASNMVELYDRTAPADPTDLTKP